MTESIIEEIRRWAILAQRPGVILNPDVDEKTIYIVPIETVDGETTMFVALMNPKWRRHALQAGLRLERDYVQPAAWALDLNRVALTRYRAERRIALDKSRIGRFLGWLNDSPLLRRFERTALYRLLERLIP